MSIKWTSAMFGSLAMLSFAASGGCGGDAGPREVDSHQSHLDDGNAPAMKDVTIDVVATGCSGYQKVSDNVLYHVTFDEARASSSVDGVQNLACTVTFTYRYPAGYSFTPSLSVDGFSQLEGSLTGTMNVRETLAGTASATKSFAAADYEDFRLDLPSGGDLGSTPCGASSATVTVALDATLTGTGSGLMGVFGIGGDIQWQRCP